ncbi:MAG TPA: S9 family peptidase [Beijerinckiaceae bacterium]|jgi:oligopeptidase B|nr:S9 family peptidase [Beijerinckiaceae bacterium]
MTAHLDLAEAAPRAEAVSFPASREPLPPVAARRPRHRVVHGTELVDPYAWLRADNWQEVLRDPSALPADIAAYLRAENAYTDAVLAPTRDLQSRLLKELRGRIKEDDRQVPWPDGAFDYYTRYREGGQHPIICRWPRGSSSEQILLDGDALGQGQPFLDIGCAEHSPDHALLAWSTDTRGSEFFTIRVRDLSSGRDFADEVVNSDGHVVWSADARAFYYVHVDENHRPDQVFRHRLGTDPAEDELILEELDPAWFIHIHRSLSGRFAIVSMHDHNSAECHLIELNEPQAKARLVAAREPGVRYDVAHRGDWLYMRTNADGAEDFKIVRAPLVDPIRANWQDEVRHRRGRFIIAGGLYQDYSVRLEREDGLPRIVVRDEQTREEHAIGFEEEAYSLDIHSGYEFDTSILRFTYSSMTTPAEVYDYDMRTRMRVLRKRQEIPSGHDPARYVTRRLMAPAQDGELVPISLLCRADLVHKGRMPLLLQGYGAYGSAMPASFNANRLSLVDRGFVYALAHIRGGTDKGWHWYEEGKLDKKPNTFSDFIAAAHHLITEGWTTRKRIVAQGGSAGGLLMGAVANLAPELFAGIIADVPFVDVINTILDDTLPLTPPEWLEWGNPIKDAQAFKTMLSYSPYDNVASKVYPPILALGGLTDPRVTYWEPAKWVAKLRATMAGGGPILLKTNTDAGHAGASGRFSRLEQTALQQAFALWCVGMA